MLDELIQKAKDNGCLVFKTELPGGPYVYRSINRLEYRGIQDKVQKKALARTKALAGDDVDPGFADRAREDGEEELVSLALLSPDLAGIELNAFPAGVVTKIADLIMEASGFGPDQPTVEQL